MKRPKQTHVLKERLEFQILESSSNPLKNHVCNIIYSI